MQAHSTAPIFTRDDKLEIQKMYVIKLMPPREIAEKTGFNSQQISDLARRMNWTKRKKEAELKLGQLIQRETSSIVSETDEFLESARIRAAGLLEKGFDLAEGSATLGDTKGFSASMSGSKVAYDIYRNAAGLDTQVKGNTTINMAVFFGNPVDAPTPQSQDIVDV